MPEHMKVVPSQGNLRLTVPIPPSEKVASVRVVIQYQSGWQESHEDTGSSEAGRTAVDSIEAVDSRAVDKVDADDDAVIYRDPDYYWEMVTFELWDTLFRVPIHHFTKQASCFLVESNRISIEWPGPSLEPVIRLYPLCSGLDDFTDLLSILYPHIFNVRPRAWLSVLRVASEFGAVEIRDEAIRRISHDLSYSCIWRIIEGIQCGAANVFLDGVTKSLHCEACTDARSMASLFILSDINIGLKLAHLREQILRKHISSPPLPFDYLSTCESLLPQETCSLIESMFQAEIIGATPPESASDKDDRLVKRILQAKVEQRPDCLRNAYTSLAERSSPLSLEEFKDLGTLQATKVLQARTELLKRAVKKSITISSCGRPLPPHDHQECVRLAREAFVKELEAAKKKDLEIRLISRTRASSLTGHGNMAHKDSTLIMGNTYVGIGTHPQKHALPKSFRFTFTS